MTGKSIKAHKFLSVILIVAGVGSAVWGYRMSESIGSRLSETLSGAPADNVMLAYIFAAVCIVLGLYLFGKK